MSFAPLSPGELPAIEKYLSLSGMHALFIWSLINWWIDVMIKVLNFVGFRSEIRGSSSQDLALNFMRKQGMS